MSIPSTNDYTGRIWRWVPGVTGTIPFSGNIKIKGGNWSGGTAADQCSFTDEAGREYDFIFPSAGDLRIGEMGWISGPITITIAPPHVEILLYVGTK